MATTYPYGYGTEYLTIDALFARVEGEAGGPMHPTYRYWLREWIIGQGGLIGIGDGWRPYDSDTSEASASNKSFHQTQRFASGLETWCAVDVVAANPGGKHRGVTWAEVPAQGTPAADEWNVHANVGTPGVVGSEPWHIQPTNIDGFDSWDRAGRPDPLPLAPDTPTPPDPTPPPMEDDMPGYQLVLTDVRADKPVYLVGLGFKTWMSAGDGWNQIQQRLAECCDGTVPSPWDGIIWRRFDHGGDDVIASYGPILGERPAGVDEFGRRGK